MVIWSQYDQYEDILNRYLPQEGQGDTRASQAVVCVNTIVYKYYNDFDTSSADVTRCLDWLRKYIPVTSSYIDTLEDADTKDAYSDALYALADKVLDSRSLSVLEQQPAVGDIYTSTDTHAEAVFASTTDSQYLRHLLETLNADKRFHDVTDAELENNVITLTLTVGKQVSSVTVPVDDLSLIDEEDDLNYIFNQLSSVAFTYDNWKLLDTKTVEWNSKPTNYNMWYSPSAQLYAFTIGDPDTAGPGSVADWIESDYNDAISWFKRWGEYSNTSIQSSIVASPITSSDSDGIITHSEIINWLYQSEPDAASEIEQQFNTDDLTEIDYDDIMDSIMDKPRLFEQMLQDLGHSELVDSDAQPVPD